MLGEVAARLFSERPAALISFAPSDFTTSPLQVTWHRNGSDSETCEEENFWQEQVLHQFLEQSEEDIKSWSDMLERARNRFTHLTFLDNLNEHLVGQPFSRTIAQRAIELLHILNKIKASYTPTGERTAEAEQLIENYFRREKAIFTDASASEKNDPARRAAMTFKLPDGSPIECFWHGKISHRYFRIHFNPIESDQPLYIGYIGPHT